jgi:hypothetical protein
LQTLRRFVSRCAAVRGVHRAAPRGDWRLTSEEEYGITNR